MSAYDLRIGMIDGAHKAVALPYCRIDDKPWYCLRRLVEYLECKSVGTRIHRPAYPFPYASACAPLTIGHLRFFDPATKIGPCQIGHAFRGLHGEFRPLPTHPCEGTPAHPGVGKPRDAPGVHLQGSASAIKIRNFAAFQVGLCCAWRNLLLIPAPGHRPTSPKSRAGPESRPRS